MYGGFDAGTRRNGRHLERTYPTPILSNVNISYEAHSREIFVTKLSRGCANRSFENSIQDRRIIDGRVCKISPLLGVLFYDAAAHISGVPPVDMTPISKKASVFMRSITCPITVPGTSHLMQTSKSHLSCRSGLRVEKKAAVRLSYFSSNFRPQTPGSRLSAPMMHDLPLGLPKLPPPILCEAAHQVSVLCAPFL